MALAKYARVCAQNSPGNQFLAIAELANVTAIVVTSGEISTITSTAGFMQVGFEYDSLERKEVAAPMKNQISYTKSIEFNISKPSKENNTWIAAMAAAIPCGVLALVQDNSGKVWLMGYTVEELLKKPLNTLGVSLESGKAAGEADKNIEKITISCVSSGKSLPLDSTLTGTLNAGTATWISWV